MSLSVQYCNRWFYGVAIATLSVSCMLVLPGGPEIAEIFTHKSKIVGQILLEKPLCIGEGTFLRAPRVLSTRQPVIEVGKERAEVHFNTRLQAQELLASTSRGEVDFTPALHP
jgi:hypothetical protein